MAPQTAAMTKFSGSCHATGFTRFFPARAIVPVPSGYELHWNGTCTGTLDGAPFDGPAKFDAFGDMKTPMSCVTGESTDGGPATITFITGSAAPPSPPAHARSHATRKARRHGHRRKRAHQRSGARAASAPARAAAPAPAPEYRVLSMWADEITLANQLIMHTSGFYRGHAVGRAEFAGDASVVEACATSGVYGSQTTVDLQTVEELAG